MKAETLVSSALLIASCVFAGQEAIAMSVARSDAKLQSRNTAASSVLTRRDDLPEQCQYDGRLRCLIVCQLDKRCQKKEFNHKVLTCACPCQTCPDGKTYGPTMDYTSVKPLSDEDKMQCPNVKAPCPGVK